MFLLLLLPTGPPIRSTVYLVRNSYQRQPAFRPHSANVGLQTRPGPAPIMIKPRKEISTPPMVLNFCSPCTLIGLSNRTTRWWKVGKEMQMQMECLSLSVFQTTISGTSAFHAEFLDWSLLCRDRNLAGGVYLGHSAEPAKHVSFLSRTYLPAIS